MISSKRNIDIAPSPLRRPTIILVVLGTLAVFSGPLIELPFLSVIGSWFWLLGLTLPYLYDYARGRSQSDDRAVIATQLAAMLRMGIPLEEALDTLSRCSWVHTLSRSFSALPILARAVGSGSRLDEAVEATEAFPPSWTALLREVRHSDGMPDALDHLAQVESRRFVVPGILVARLFLQVPLMLLVFSFLVVYIFPTFIQLAEGLQVALPIPVLLTLMIGRSAGLVLALVALGLLAMAIPPVRQTLGVWAGRLPGIWPLTRLSEQARFCEVAGAACELNLPVPEVLGVARAAATQSAYRRAFESGNSLSEVMHAHPRLFDPRLAWLVEQGERTEDLPGALETGRSLLHTRFRHEERRLGHWLDLCLLLILGLVSAIGCAATFITLNLLVNTVVGL